MQDNQILLWAIILVLRLTFSLISTKINQKKVQEFKIKVITKIVCLDNLIIKSFILKVKTQI